MPALLIDIDVTVQWKKDCGLTKIFSSEAFPFVASLCLLALVQFARGSKSCSCALYRLSPFVYIFIYVCKSICTHTYAYKYIYVRVRLCVEVV